MGTGSRFRIAAVTVGLVATSLVFGVPAPAGATTGVTVAGGNGSGGAANQFDQPVALVVRAGAVFVLDSENDRVQRWPLPPGLPTGGVARSGSTTTAAGSLVVTFTTPPTGGSPIATFGATCTSADGGAVRTASGSASPITVNGVTTGKTYTCAVRATNAAGAGPFSAASGAVIVGSPPAPTLTGVTRPNPGRLRVAYTPNGSNGSPLIGFTAGCVSSNGGATGTKTVTDPAQRAVTVTGLTVGKTYTCPVRATNARGTGLPSNPSGTKTA